MRYGAGVLRIFEERLEQVKKHGYDAGHDDAHKHGELEDAARCVLRGIDVPSTAIDRAHIRTVEVPREWPWEPESYRKIMNHDRIGRLAIAGALIAAAIERAMRNSDVVNGCSQDSLQAVERDRERD